RHLPAEAPATCAAVPRGASGSLAGGARGDVTCHRQFSVQLPERGDVVVALDHGGRRAEALQRLGIKRPHCGRDRVIMGVDEVTLHVAMAGEVKLPDSRHWHGGQILVWIE